jgi:hypothetical protein
MGRRDPTGTPSIELFNPATRQWRTLTQMATGRWGAGLVSLGGGEGGEGCDEVYLVGGSSESSRLSSVLVYNVSNDQWTAMAEMSVARNGVGVVTARGRSCDWIREGRRERERCIIKSHFLCSPSRSSLCHWWF